MMFKKPMVWVAVVVVAAGGFLLFRPDKLFVDDVVDESLEDAFASGEVTTTTIPVVTTESPSLATTGAQADTTEPPETASSTTAPAGPTELSAGSFFGIDHSASGSARIYEQDGRYILRFEDDTDIQNGPDLYVWVTSGTDWYSPGEYLDLGKLKGNVGGQNYELPPEFDPAIHRHVLIWCLRFTVPFAAAEMS